MNISSSYRANPLSQRALQAPGGRSQPSQNNEVPEDSFSFGGDLGCKDYLTMAAISSPLWGGVLAGAAMGASTGQLANVVGGAALGGSLGLALILGAGKILSTK